MIHHNLTQGSPEWLAYRRSKFNASDAPAMMGVSPQKTRNQLLAEIHSGLSAEVSDYVQEKVFDPGHRFEALARPLAEGIINEPLYPITGSNGKLSASYDGLTMLEDQAFEHKRMNEDLRAVLSQPDCVGAMLPMLYQVQMEQQLMVADDCKRVLFMASEWDNNDQLVEELHCWYHPNPVLADAIRAGWEQFEADLAAYVPTETEAPKPTGRTPETLPALRIELMGAVTVSNLGAYKEHALAVFESINRNLESDQDFADAEKTVKWCGEVESRLVAAKQHALSQTASIDELFRTIDEIGAEARRVRLDLDKLVSARKEAIRSELVASGNARLREHIEARNARIGKPYMPAIHADFARAIKSKRTVESLRNAVDTELARAKIEANTVADRIILNLDFLRANAENHKFLFADTATIVLKAADDFEMLVKSRIEAHDKAEADRLEAEREHAAKVEAERAQAALAAQQAADAQREAEQQAELIAQQARQASEADQAATLVQQPATVDEMHAIGNGIMYEQQATVDLTNPLAVRAMASAILAKAADTDTPPIKLGEISARLGFTVTADFLSCLGIQSVGTERAAKLYRDSDFPRICDALIAHITTAKTAQAVAA